MTRAPTGARRAGRTAPPESFPPTLRPALLAWYRANRRDLPWRRTRDPYAIWIAETMLQQTRVDTVIPYYQRFLSRFPDVAALASADLEAVLFEWAGLGSYSRARNLRVAAQRIADGFGGCVPDDVESLRSLPGVGRYTAGAVASIAYDRPVAVLDGTVTRVLARLLEIRNTPTLARVQERLWRAAEALARGRSPGDLNQALMELGATLCTPRAPDCRRCPVARCCKARRAGDPESIPPTAPRKAKRVVTNAVALVTRGGRLLAVRRPDRGLLGGLWELPGGELLDGETPLRGVRRALHETVGLRVSQLSPVGVVQHDFTHFRLRAHVFRGAARPRERVRLDGLDRHRWMSRAGLGELPRSRAGSKAIELALSGAPGAR